MIKTIKSRGKFLLASLAATVMVAAGLFSANAPSADAAQWIGTGKSFTTALACDHVGHYYVYEFEKHMPNGDVLGYASWDCVDDKHGHYLLALLGFVKK